MWFNLPKSALGRSLFQRKYCKHTNCILTNDHSRLKEADVLLFYFGDGPNWPKIRYPQQYYAHFIHEAPGKRRTRTFLDKYEGKINLTINFRHDADVYVPYNTFFRRLTSIPYKPRVPLAMKTKMAVWPVSHCKTSSQREDYVKELSKYIDVDIFGACGPYKCKRSKTHDCLNQWEKTYKFYLSFENNICDDYITEKLFKTLDNEIIPIVLGGGNYTNDAPPHSVINVLDFSSPKSLADYLIELGKNETRYYDYFKWKSDYEMANIYSIMMCRLCDGLHEGRFPHRPASRHYADYWYGPHGERCDSELMSREEIDYDVDEFIGLQPYQHEPEANKDESEEPMNLSNYVRKSSQDAPDVSEW
ncbi:hypothetical protein LSH36_816g00037 [Paralvinella palmiformis]|uniref:Fucosyltransferase n=1 Tax=Paralvinella palmiformis TaxID=53620 RepID=A0AAD9J009_9ANNE|nr:hypothetical protein LSH36_816g00037 [Paralvinella palmiformis]